MVDPQTLRERVRARLAEQRALVLRLLDLREQLPGSLFARYGTCGKETCTCRTGAKHGPYLVLSTRSAGRGAFEYLEDAQAGEVRDLVSRHRQFQDGLRRLKKVNGEVVSLLKRYQSAMAKQGRKRMRAAAPSAQKSLL
jgi:hypothetical protein